MVVRMDLHSAHPSTHLQSLAAGSLVCAELAYTMVEIEHVRTNWQTCQLWSPNSSNMASSRVLQSSYTFWSGLLFLREFTHILSLSNSLPHPPKHPMWSGFTHTHTQTHTRSLIIGVSAGVQILITMLHSEFRGVNRSRASVSRFCMMMTDWLTDTTNSLRYCTG